VLLPNALFQKPGLEPKPGRWHRQYTGPVDIRWFGAQSGENVIATDAIQNAILAVTGSGPAGEAEIFVPPGGFLAHIMLPRLGENRNGITIRGAGIHSSEILWNGQEPVVDFSGPDQLDAMNYRFHSIMFRHAVPGHTVFRHVPRGEGRLLYCTFVDVAFFSRAPDRANPVEYAPVANLFSMFNARLDRVWFSGSAGILIGESSRNFLTAVRTFQDSEQTDGIVLDSCNETVIDGPRIDGLFGPTGDGICIANSTNVTLRNTSFEGKRGRSCIRIDNSSNITLDNCNMGGGPIGTQPWAALWITGNSENIRIEGGRINVNDITGIRIDPGARSIRGRAIEFAQSSAAAMGSYLNIDTTVPDVRIESFTHTDARVEFAQTVGDADIRGAKVLLKRWEDVRVSGAKGAVTIEDILQGVSGDGPSVGLASPGRRVALFISSGAVTVASGGQSKIRLIGGAPWTPRGDAMIELVFDGTLWYELGRNG
jgi:hypothetical protein